MAKFNPTINRWTRRRSNAVGKRATDKRLISGASPKATDDFGRLAETLLEHVR
ncbi:hypothetical protein O2N63_06190 [Aliiroseovarius sp. KMU-50]|uniref:Uncharacterized protein n=1 Tax=Aliiroseovarius salicola TaxID=3009082 RepID=A0ABT4VZJ1_9RHOB|nr:hypothetical protein [Aliiroseovarius sp. KMU-50]MDA5093673.1 hypothetical protein [Aliiroseovarius sp. KMU-50]